MNAQELIYSFFHNRTGVLATMHEKEKVIAPVLENRLGITLKVPENFNSDHFGTFTREVERKGNQLEAARFKAEAALDQTGETIAISSEGSFGPHPFMPFVSYNREIVYLVDKKNGLEIWGEEASTETNYSHESINSLEEAHEFCKRIGFPEHAVIIRCDNQIIKGINNQEQLEDVIVDFLKNSTGKKVTIETDMRALYNPTRMKVIKAATENLVKKIFSLCPACSFPGFEVIERKAGLICGGCGFKTKQILSEIYSCKKCGESEEKLYPHGREQADPMYCDYCNP